MNITITNSYKYLTKNNISIRITQNIRRKFKISFAYFINVLYNSYWSHKQYLNILSVQTSDIICTYLLAFWAFHVLEFHNFCSAEISSAVQSKLSNANNIFRLYWMFQQKGCLDIVCVTKGSQIEYL